MIKLTLILSFLIVINFTNAQDFCGVIRYKYTYYRGKSQKDITAKVKEVKTEDFFVCGGKFKIYFDEKLSEILITDSLTYFLVKDDSTAGFIKADSAYGQAIPDYEKIKEGVVFNSKTYKSIKVDSKKDFVTYYFNDDIKINPELFKDVELYHWNKYFAATNGSLRLVGISRKRRLTTISEAVEIKRMDLGDLDFSFPKGFNIEPWNYFRVYN